MRAKPGDFVIVRRLPGAAWWPSRVPDEVRGILERVAMMPSGAVMGRIRTADGRTYWVPWSPKFIRVY